MTIRVALIGFGKIAADQHVPAIAADPRFELAAVTARSGDPDIGVPWFAEAAEMFAEMEGRLDAVAICTPPGARYGIALQAIDAGLAVLLEKPPAATLGEIEALEAHAREKGACLYAGWHSQHAPAVAPAAAALKDASGIARLDIIWREDVRKWHPGQDWIFEPQGFGVFDPGINALSIASAILPDRLFVESAQLEVPENRQAPIAAKITFSGGNHHADFDFRHSDGEEWTIAIETAEGRHVELREGGARLIIDGEEQPLGPREEYPAMYRRFADLIATGSVEIDREPLRIMADAVLAAQRTAVASFIWTDGG
ncbi:MAG: Gfo/Idh/MocA family protein [Blastomonas sp.]